MGSTHGENVRVACVDFRETRHADTLLDIPLITKSEEVENMATELKEFFPDHDVSGLVARKRRSSIVSLDIDDPLFVDDVSVRQDFGSSAECSREELDNIDNIPRDFRRRTVTQGKPYIIQ